MIDIIRSGININLWSMHYRWEMLIGIGLSIMLGFAIGYIYALVKSLKKVEVKRNKVYIPRGR